MRNVLATIAGFIVAALVVYIFESLIGQNLFPLPEGSDPTNMEWLRNNMDKVPTGAKVFVVIGHFLGIVAGMFLAGLISKTSMVPAYIVGMLMVAAAFFNIFVLPKELWFSAADGALALAGFFLGTKLAAKQIAKE